MSENSPESQGHPAWQSILDKLPEDLHGIIKPELEAWDRGVQGKLQDVRSQYDPYKDLVEQGVDPQQIQQSLYIANHLQTNPQEFVQKAIETFGLTLPQAQQLQQDLEDDDDDPYDQYGNDITKDPRYKALHDTVTELQGKWSQKEQETLQEQQAREFETYLDSLAESNKERGEFDRTYVTALMAQGIKGEQAVEQFYNTVNQAAARIAGVPQQNNNQSTPPVVMGSEGNTGSGLPSDPVNMGSLKRNDVDNLVVEMLNRMNQT